MNNILLDKKTRKIDKKLAEAYISAQKSIISDCEDLYLEMLENGKEVSYSQLMRYDRYFKLNVNINKELRKLGLQEISILDEGMRELFFEVGTSLSPNFALINSTLVEQTVNRIWCSDGKLWSDRIWTSKSKLQSTLQEELTNCVISGKSHKVLTKKLKERFGVADHEAERLARTELNYVQNQASMKGYQDAGYEYYQFITAKDSRTCGECEKLDGQIFAFKDAVVGVNYPPIHSNCRSNIIGYKED